MFVFAITLGVAGLIIFQTTRSTIEDQTKASITEDFSLLRDAQTTGGPEELSRFVRKAVATRSDRQFAFGVFDPNGKWLAGNISTAPSFRGWGILQQNTVQSSSTSEFLGYAQQIGGDLVVAAGTLRSASAVNGANLAALILAGLVVCMSGLAIGYVLGQTVSSKLEVMDRTLAEVSRGNTRARLPVATSNDQIDHLSRQINAHLDRLDDLMQSTRNTIVAIAHDLKSPLNRAYLLLNDAADQGSAGEASATLAQAASELDGVREVMDAVLRISRIETSDDRASFEDFSASELVLDLCQTFAPVFEASGQTLCGVVPPNDPAPIFGDRRMVQQLLVNLLENASRHGGEAVAIVISCRTEDGATILTVADNGPGIPQDRRGEVLKPFHRLNVARDTPGAGLGLSLVQAIATRHHATMRLDDNRPGLIVQITFSTRRELTYFAKT